MPCCSCNNILPRGTKSMQTFKKKGAFYLHFIEITLDFNELIKFEKKIVLFFLYLFNSITKYLPILMIH